jgi:hypothetical protein
MELGAIALAEVYGVVERHLRLLGKIAAIQNAFIINHDFLLFTLGPDRVRFGVLVLPFVKRVFPLAVGPGRQQQTKY